MVKYHGSTTSQPGGAMHSSTFRSHVKLWKGREDKRGNIAGHWHYYKQGRKPIRCEYCKISCQLLVDIKADFRLVGLQCHYIYIHVTYLHKSQYCIFSFGHSLPGSLGHLMLGLGSCKICRWSGFLFHKLCCMSTRQTILTSVHALGLDMDVFTLYNILSVISLTYNAPGYSLLSQTVPPDSPPRHLKVRANCRV